VLSKCSFLRCWPAREETVDFGEKRSKTLTWVNFATPSTGTMTEVEEDEEEAEASEPEEWAEAQAPTSRIRRSHSSQRTNGCLPRFMIGNSWFW
jgi:hypothetical protein